MCTATPGWMAEWRLVCIRLPRAEWVERVVNNNSNNNLRKDIIIKLTRATYRVVTHGNKKTSCAVVALTAPPTH